MDKLKFKYIGKDNNGYMMRWQVVQGFGYYKGIALTLGSIVAFDPYFYWNGLHPK